MQAAHPVSALMFGTLGIVALAILAALLWFLRKPSNRNAGERIRERGTPGAPDVPRGEPIDPKYRVKR